MNEKAQFSAMTNKINVKNREFHCVYIFFIAQYHTAL
jgi:hypothetical protein